jgi:hypothetical protein
MTSSMSSGCRSAWRRSRVRRLQMAEEAIERISVVTVRVSAEPVGALWRSQMWATVGHLDGPARATTTCRIRRKTNSVTDPHVGHASPFADDLSLSCTISLLLTAAMLTTIMSKCEMGVRVRHRGDHLVLFHHKFVSAVGFKWWTAFEAHYAGAGVGHRSLGRLIIVGPSRLGYGRVVSCFPSQYCFFFAKVPHNIVCFIIQPFLLVVVY